MHRLYQIQQRNGSTIADPILNVPINCVAADSRPEEPNTSVITIAGLQSPVVTFDYY
jgi:hypothetical protein